MIVEGAKMTFGNVETNIETQEQYEHLIRRIYEWFIALKYPGYKIKSIEKR
jgi:hypothetical protein